MSVGKRLSTDQPLTEHDIAERLDHAALRAARILHDIRVNHPELLEAVKGSRYLTNAPHMLAHELQEWGFAPIPAKTEPAPARRRA